MMVCLHNAILLDHILLDHMKERTTETQNNMDVSYRHYTKQKLSHMMIWKRQELNYERRKPNSCWLLVKQVWGMTGKGREGTLQSKENIYPKWCVLNNSIYLSKLINSYTENQGSHSM